MAEITSRQFPIDPQSMRKNGCWSVEFLSNGENEFLGKAGKCQSYVKISNSK
jgi:hypothetical protein